MGSETKLKFPVIDFSKQKLKPGSETWLATCKQVCNVLEEYGFFVAECGDYFSLDLHNTIFKEAKDLFDLPIEVKKQNTSDDKPFYGYFSANSVHESMGIDNATTLEGVRNFTNLMWPEGHDSFRENCHNIAMILERLDQMVIRMVFENYGVVKQFDTHIGSTDYVLRFSKYKKLQDKLGLQYHTDKTFTTILHQNHVNGLQLQLKNGEYIGFDPPSHSSFLFLAGDGLKIWSNNRIHSCRHGVIMNGYETRYSLGLYTYFNGVIHIPDELVDDEHPLKYKPFDHLEFLKIQMKLAHEKEFHLEDYCMIK